MEVEKLYTKIKKLPNVGIKNEDTLKTKLKTFFISHLKSHTSEALTKNEKEAIKNLKLNKDIIQSP